MRNGGAAHKNRKRREVLIALRAHRHFERSREIFIAERLSSHVRRHQDIILPQRIHADSRSAVKIEGCAQDDDAGESQSLLIPNPQSLATHPLKYREKHDTYGSWQNAFFSCKIVVKYYSVVIIGKL